MPTVTVAQHCQTGRIRRGLPEARLKLLTDVINGHSIRPTNTSSELRISSRGSENLKEWVYVLIGS